MKKDVLVRRLGIILVLSIFSVSYVRQEMAVRRVNEEKKNVEEELNRLNEENSKLTNEIKNSESDAYIEHVAREKLGMIKKGEKVIINSEKN
ncbi:septum formation initiator family protein [Clostridium sp.]|uniref:septum formation initiator family protein n=1 Tax=Clostridium sp. TaxID=1506 RepID=UPI0039935D70